MLSPENEMDVLFSQRKTSFSENYGFKMDEYIGMIKIFTQ